MNKAKARRKKARSQARPRTRTERSINPDPALSPGLEESYEQERATEDAAGSHAEPEPIDDIIGSERAPMGLAEDGAESVDESAVPPPER